MNELDKMLDEYQEYFDENFPVMLCRTMDDSEIIKIIESCIVEGKVYEPELDVEANY